MTRCKVTVIRTYLVDTAALDTHTHILPLPSFQRCPKPVNTRRSCLNLARKRWPNCQRKWLVIIRCRSPLFDCSLPEEDIRSKYMTVPVKPPEVKPEELYKLPKRPKKSDNPADDARR